MEKMKRRSAWMRIMAVMLALVTGITMVPLDTMAATEKDSEAYVQSSETVADELIADNVYDLAESGHSHADCDCGECNDREVCDCDNCHDHAYGIVETDNVTPDGSGPVCYHENMTYAPIEGNCYFHLASLIGKSVSL